MTACSERTEKSDNGDISLSPMIDRREFLTGSFGAALPAPLPANLLASSGNPQSQTRWDPSRLTHLIPTVSDTALLIEASFSAPLSAPPNLRITPCIFHATKLGRHC
jgi:hypothetical protein